MNCFGVLARARRKSVVSASDQFFNQPFPSQWMRPSSAEEGSPFMTYADEFTIRLVKVIADFYDRDRTTYEAGLAALGVSPGGREKNNEDKLSLLRARFHRQAAAQRRHALHVRNAAISPVVWNGSGRVLKWITQRQEAPSFTVPSGATKNPKKPRRRWTCRPSSPTGERCSASEKDPLPRLRSMVKAGFQGEVNGENVSQLMISLAEHRTVAERLALALAVQERFGKLKPLARRLLDELRTNFEREITYDRRDFSGYRAPRAIEDWVAEHSPLTPAPERDSWFRRFTTCVLKDSEPKTLLVGSRHCIPEVGTFEGAEVFRRGVHFCSRSFSRPQSALDHLKQTRIDPGGSGCGG